ncbi:hypothetical protein CAPTEDRAFT_226345 [Capitella teleta]|uniref:Inosine/uridine-preferring nucleoside hydrolase domain-containing protein n=1 Tax=Capitella teleta TaxID=283909 RepID=R7TY39_CAPTE|nr:hypothetical protein CAPTEDRAFT_226345 [Capitella teleta]|eukprot:ELT98557.1 hypothetical protein CAPTEDRAFT_226345 [Capitella teleta]
MRLIIDTDTGIDDAQALLMAFNCPDVEVVAITTCHGNVDVEQINLNVLRVLKTVDRFDVPVFGGCKASLVGDRKTSAHYHGLDGLGDAPDAHAPPADLIHGEHAVHALVRMANENPGEYTLVCLAPLTNIALAMRLDPGFSKNLKGCYIMGGNYEGKGNITSCAEFNFHTDPEAADVVLREMTCEVTVVGWELCLKAAFSWDWYEKFISQESPSANFMRRIEGSTIDNYYSNDAKLKEGVTKYTTADQLAMAVCLCSSLVENKFECLASVSLSDGITRGQMIPDARGRAMMHAKPEQRCVVVTNIKQALYGEIMMSALMNKSDASVFWKNISTKQAL